MAQADFRRPLKAETRVRDRVSSCGICGGQWHWGRFSSEFFGYTLPISFHHISPCWFIIWGMNNMPVSGRSSETQSKPIDMNKNNNKPHYEAFTTWTDVPHPIYGTRAKTRNTTTDTITTIRARTSPGSLNAPGSRTVTRSPYSSSTQCHSFAEQHHVRPFHNDNGGQVTDDCSWSRAREL
jgi:hypothetical protein